MRRGKSTIFADKIKDAVYEKYSELSGDDPKYDFKVIAGICMTRGNSEKIEVVSIGTGTKTISGDEFSTLGVRIVGQSCFRVMTRQIYRSFKWKVVATLNRNVGTAKSGHNVFKPVLG